MNHLQKQQRFAESVVVQDGYGVTLAVLWAPRYKRNLSARRMLHHGLASREFLSTAGTMAVPDVVFSCYPPDSMCMATGRYAQTHKIPFLLDVRDMWPDIIIDRVSAPFRLIMGVLILPFLWHTRQVFSSANAITGITEGMVSWAVHRAGREQRENDVPFHLACYSDAVDQQDLNAARAYWNTIIPNNALIVIFIGTFGRHLQLESAIEAVK